MDDKILEQTIKAVSVFLIVVAFVSNLLVIFTILKYKVLRTIFNCMICSLCFTYIISTLTSSLYLVGTLETHQNICIAYWAVELATDVSTALHIFSISIRRLRSVLNPYKVFDTSKILIAVFIILLWIFSAVTASIPFLVTNTNVSCGRCEKQKTTTVNPAETHEANFIIYAVCYGLIVTVILMLVIATFRTGRHKVKTELEKLKDDDPEEMKFEVRFQVATGKVKTAQSKLRKSFFATKNQKELFVQLILVAMCFFIGNTVSLLQSFSHMTKVWFCDKTWYLSFLLMRFSECLSPLMIVAGSKSVKKKIFCHSD